MIANHLVVPFILRDFESDVEYLKLQEKKTEMIAAGKHRTTETYGGKLYYVYTPEFIELNNALLALEGLRNWGGGDQHYRLLTEKERANTVVLNLGSKENV
jgi:hypothetical protein